MEGANLMEELRSSGGVAGGRAGIFLHVDHGQLRSLDFDLPGTRRKFPIRAVDMLSREEWTTSVNAGKFISWWDVILPDT